MGIGYKPRELKVIDLTDHAARQAALAKELVAAATDIGFFYVTGHGISQAEVDGQFATAKRCATGGQLHAAALPCCQPSPPAGQSGAPTYSLSTEVPHGLPSADSVCHLGQVFGFA